MPSITIIAELAECIVLIVIIIIIARCTDAHSGALVCAMAVGCESPHMCACVGACVHARARVCVYVQSPPCMLLSLIKVSSLWCAPPDAAHLPLLCVFLCRHRPARC